MSQFIDDAVEILPAAESVMGTGQTPGQYSILLGLGGGIRMIADSDWPLDSLQREYGANTAYRVSTSDGRVKVDGNHGNRTCHFEATPPAQVAQFLLNTVPAWHTFPQLA